MEAKDVDAVLSLLKLYLEKFDMAPMYTREEVVHWLLPKEADPSEQVVWTYVVEVIFTYNSETEIPLLTISGRHNKRNN